MMYSMCIRLGPYSIKDHILYHLSGRSTYEFKLEHTKVKLWVQTSKRGSIMAISRLFWWKIHIISKLYIKRCRIIWRSFWYYCKGRKWSCVGGSAKKLLELSLNLCNSIVTSSMTSLSRIIFQMKVIDPKLLIQNFQIKVIIRWR